MNFHRSLLCTWLCAVFAACASGPDDRAPLRGVVASASPEATAAGVEVLAAGGNAVDAAVAIACALAVTEPAGSGFGGQAFFLIHPPNGSPVVISGSSLAPAGTPTDAGRDDLVGRRATTVPSFVKVIDAARRKYGSGEVSWEELLEPAARAAESGFALGPFRHGSTARYARALRLDPDVARVFLTADGATPRIGTVVKQPALAKMIRHLARAGAEDFYRGEIAAKIAADMAANDGWMTAKDLADFPEPEIVPAVHGTYRGWDVYTLPPPTGGWVVMLALNLLEQVSTATLGGTSDNGTIWLAEALRAAHGERVDDPLYSPGSFEEGVRRRTDKAHAASIARTLDPPGSGETTHFSVADSDGLVVSATLSLNAYFGAKVMCADLGLLYNDYMREFETGIPGHPFALRASAKPYSSMSAVILAKDGVARAAIGSPGSRRIISAVTQVVRNWVDRRMTITEAVAAPRIHVIPEDDDVLFERRPTSRTLVRELELRGMSVSIPVSSLIPGNLNPYFGGVHAVALRDVVWSGAADPRRDGTVGYARSR